MEHAGLKINGMWGEDESWEDEVQSLSPVCAGHEIYLSVLCYEASVRQHLESAFLQLSADLSNCCPQCSSHLLTAFLGYKVCSSSHENLLNLKIISACMAWLSLCPERGIGDN